MHDGNVSGDITVAPRAAYDYAPRAENRVVDALLLTDMFP